MYNSIVQYFLYPLSSIEKEVENAIINHEDTEEFYMKKCEKNRKIIF